MEAAIADCHMQLPHATRPTDEPNTACIWTAPVERLMQLAACLPSEIRVAVPAWLPIPGLDMLLLPSVTGKVPMNPCDLAKLLSSNIRSLPVDKLHLTPIHPSLIHTEVYTHKSQL